MMQSKLDMTVIQAFFWSLISIIGVVLMAVTYSYINKLERIKCVCAEHPHRKFIKKYLIFALVFLTVTAFVPPSVVVGTVGPLYAFVYMVVNWIYVVSTVVFFIFALRYVRYLVQEKCKCSEDIRREVLYWWSVVELVILSILVLLPFLMIFINGTISLSIVSGKNVMKNLEETVMMSSVDPLKGVAKATSSLKKTMKTPIKE